MAPKRTAGVRLATKMRRERLDKLFGITETRVSMLSMMKTGRRSPWNGGLPSRVSLSLSLVSLVEGAAGKKTGER